MAHNFVSEILADILKFFPKCHTKSQSRCHTYMHLHELILKSHDMIILLADHFV